MSRTVLLWHHGIPTKPGAAPVPDHFDWLIERPAGGGELLVAFRVSERLDRLDLRVFDALRLPDHRPMYLDYEGPVSGDRGVVARVATGRCGKLVEDLSRLEVTFSLGDSLERRWEGLKHEGDRWLFNEVGFQARPADRGS